MTLPKNDKLTRQTFLASVFGLVLSNSVPAHADAAAPLEVTAKVVEMKWLVYG